MQPPAVSDQSGRDVEEPQPQTLAPGTPVLGRQREGSYPQSDVVGQGDRLPVEPVAEERLHRGMDHPEVVLQRPDDVLGDPATQPVVGLDLGRGHLLGADVGDDRVQPPPLEVIESELFTGRLGLAAHDQPQLTPEQGGGGLRDLTARLGLPTQRSGPDSVRVGCQGMDPVRDVGVLLGGDGEVRAVPLRGLDHLILVAGRVHPDPQPIPVPGPGRDRYRLWIRVDSAGYQDQVIEAAERHSADFTVTTKQYPNVADRIHALAADPDTVWATALGRETEAGSQIAETTTTLLGRELRLIVRRQPKAAGEQLAFDDLEGWRLHAIITNISPEQMTAAEVEAHHRLRGGIPEDTIRALKNDFGMIHAPVQPFFGNWLYWQAVALAHNVGLWLRTLALPAEYRRARGKRLRLGFLNVAARLVRHGRRLHLRFSAAYPHLQAFITALNRIRALPAFG